MTPSYSQTHISLASNSEVRFDDNISDFLTVYEITDVFIQWFYAENLPDIFIILRFIKLN